MVSVVLFAAPARVDVVTFGAAGQGPVASATPVSITPVSITPVSITPVSATSVSATSVSATPVHTAPAAVPVAPKDTAAGPAPIDARRAPPRALRLASAAEAIPLAPLGVLPDGALQLPDDPAWGGWWSGGSLPGDPIGPVVLAGHVDARVSGPGAFAALLDVVAGEIVDVVLSDGSTVTYTVTSREEQPKAFLPPGIFAATGEPRRVLVTCGGDFDPVTGHYADNVVVTALPR